MRLSDYIVRVLIYYNLPDLLHRNVENELLHVHEGSVWGHIHHCHAPDVKYYHRWCELFALLRTYKSNLKKQVHAVKNPSE